VPLTRVAVADWMDVSAAILGKVLIDSGCGPGQRERQGDPFAHPNSPQRFGCAEKGLETIDRAAGRK
jgi:hypothetical protein